MHRDAATLQAQRRYDGLIAVSGPRASLVFSRVWAGVGWPESEHGALCVLGESLEGVYHALGEWRGSLFELGSAAEAAWRQFLVECYWVDASDDVSTMYFRGLDFPARTGAGASKSDGRSHSRPTWAAHAEADDRPAIVGVRSAYRENFRAALETLRGVAAAGRLVVPQNLCPSAAFALRRDLGYLMQSPVAKALVWALTAMESTRDQGMLEIVPNDAWYGNFRHT